MRARDKFKYGAVGAVTLMVGCGGLLTTGWGRAEAAQIVNVFVTNDAAHPVPVHEQGTASVSVTNGSLTVSTLPDGSTPWYVSVYGTTSCGLRCKLFSPPAGATTLALTSLTFDNANSSASVFSGVFLYPAADCNVGASGKVTTADVPGQDTVHEAFPQPIVLSPGGSDWCLAFSVPADYTGILSVTAVGYYR